MYYACSLLDADNTKGNKNIYVGLDELWCTPERGKKKKKKHTLFLRVRMRNV